MVVSIYANTYHSSWQKQVMFLNSTIFYLKLEEVYLLSTFSISSTLNIMLIVNVYTIALALHWYFMYKKQNFHLPFISNVTFCLLYIIYNILQFKINFLCDCWLLVTWEAAYDQCWVASGLSKFLHGNSIYYNFMHQKAAIQWRVT